MRERERPGACRVRSPRSGGRYGEKKKERHRERERERERVKEKERGRERERESVCVREREMEGERERDLAHVAFVAYVREVGHHMRHDLVSCVFACARDQFQVAGIS